MTEFRRVTIAIVIASVLFAVLLGPFIGGGRDETTTIAVLLGWVWFAVLVSPWA